MEELITSLRSIAGNNWWLEGDSNPFECSGGNYDDAYYGGYADGQKHLAKVVLEALTGAS